MQGRKFGLIGDGYIAKYHKQAISSFGEIIRTYDPFKAEGQVWLDNFFDGLDYAVICSPSYCHYEQIKLALESGCEVIVEKPAFLPWDPLIDDDRINIVMQLREIEAYRASSVEVQMVRDERYMESWKGNHRLTGGFIFHLFIHYIDLAIRTGARFDGRVVPEGKNIRRLDGRDLTKIMPLDLYFPMYERILSGKGTKPRDIFRLQWIMQQMISQFGIGAFYKNYSFQED